MSDHAPSSTVAQVAQNSVFERLARAGFVVSGLLHLAIGYLAIRIALGSGGGSADQSGALAAGGRQTGRHRRALGPTRPPDSTEPSKHSGSNPTEQHS